MDSFFKQAHQYCEDHTSSPDSVLYELERETFLKVMSPHMISGKTQGRFLEFISRMIQPEAILEVGTFTGYASICLARGLAPNGVLHTIEIDPELKWIAQKYFAKAKVGKKIIAHQNDARALIPNLEVQFDLAFIDAAKMDNDLYYEMILPKLSPKGYLMIDNVLWAGKVVRNEQDADTQAIMAFNKKVQNDDRVENIMLPLRDGLMLVRKN